MNIPEVYLNDIVSLSQDRKTAILQMDATAAQQAIGGMIEVMNNLADFIVMQRRMSEKELSKACDEAIIRIREASKS